MPCVCTSRPFDAARENGFVQNEGLAHEVAARFYAARGVETIAHAYLRNARHCYLRWGALGKVRQLDQRYPRLDEESAPSSLTATIGASVEQLDIGAVVAASQAVSGEIVLGRLIETLMTLALEHAGAERGLLILLRGDALQIEAEARTDRQTVEVTLRQETVAPAQLPESLLHTVIRTQESVILDDASAQNPFSGDEYIRQKHPRSVLCLPLVKQAKLIGMLYLENNLASHVFTPARISVLKLLSSQAAISLENARLYAGAAEGRRVAARKRTALPGLRRDGLGLAVGDGARSSVHLGVRACHARHRARPVGSARLDGRSQPTSTRSPRSGAFIWPRSRPTSRFEVSPTGRYSPMDRAAYVATSGKPVFDAEGGFCGYRGVSSDVTAAVRADQAEHALHQAQAELAHVARVTTLGELAASIAHEINQPLAGIIADASACLRMLAGDPPNVDGARETARRTIRDGNRASDVITRLRALFSKKDAVTDSVDLNEATREVIALSSSELQRNRVILRPELADDLPPVSGDRIQLQQVILNLLMNASDAMSGVDDRPRQVVIRTERDEGDRVRLSVQDAGVGFEPQAVDKLFEAFYTTKSGGMGMGLSVSRSIIERHHGRLWAEPNDGPGATFSFSVPCNPE